MQTNQNTNRQTQHLDYAGKSNLSDLASCCEYLTNEKLCQAVIESEKAKAARQSRCQNEEKMTCCYLCMLVMDCAAPCQFLGTNEKVPLKKETEKVPVESAIIGEQKLEDEKLENTPVTFCSGCNVEMAKTRSKLTIDGWKGSQKDDLQNLGEKELPIIVYLCPKCGKIDFMAEQKK